jgi:hypothetical protein
MYLFPDPLLLQAKEEGVQRFAPLCEAERGWGEFMLLNNRYLAI